MENMANCDLVSGRVLAGGSVVGVGGGRCRRRLVFPEQRRGLLRQRARVAGRVASRAVKIKVNHALCDS